MNDSSIPLPIVTQAEHEQGFKDHLLEFRDGHTETRRLYAVDAEHAARLAKAIFTEFQPFELLIAECLVNPDSADERERRLVLADLAGIRHKLVPGEWGRLQDICIELNYGPNFIPALLTLAADLEAKEQAA